MYNYNEYSYLLLKFHDKNILFNLSENYLAVKMELVRQIEGVCTIDGGDWFKCTGTITVANQSGKSIYASWSMHDENDRVIASRSRSYFFKEEAVDEEKLLIAIMQNIINYRVARQKIFSWVILK